jgi:hypothetical protein
MTSPKRRANVVGLWCLFLVCAVSRGDTAAPAGLIAGSVLGETPDCRPERCDLLANSQTVADPFRLLRDIVGPRPGTGLITGSVLDETPDCTPEKCALLANRQTDEDAFRLLRDIVGPRPAPGAIVTARSDTVKREVVANAHSTFVVKDLPLGPYYEVSAMMPPAPGVPGPKPKVSATRNVECGHGVRLVLHEELLTVSGRITDTLGQPVSGAQVTGTVVPISEVGVPETRVAVSDATGRYTLRDLEPVNLYRVAGYLNGGNLEAPGTLHTQVEIKVEAPGFRRDRGRVPKVPLISETQLVPGRRLWQALSDRATKSNRPDRWKEMKPASLPASRGSAIIDVNIVLER